MDSLKFQWNEYNSTIFDILASSSFTKNHISNKTSYIITFILFHITILVVSYQIIYNTGIHLKLWDYHAKDYFPEVPVHCAHLYIRINIIDLKNSEKLLPFFEDQKRLVVWLFNCLKFRDYNFKSDLFILDKPIKYHIEFSPEDYVGDENPGLGSTVSHLRSKILELLKDSDLISRPKSQNLSTKSVRLFNNRAIEVSKKDDAAYLCQVNMETGNIINCVVQV